MALTSLIFERVLLGITQQESRQCYAHLNLRTEGKMEAFGAVALLAVFYYVPTICKKIVDNFKLKPIPIVGASGLLTSYIGAYRFLKHPKEMVQEGYDKYRGSVFRVPMMTQWMIVVSGADKIEDIRRATDDVLSLRRALEEVLHTNLTFGPETFEDTSLIDAIRMPLTRNIGTRYHEVHDEITTAFNHHIPVQTYQWMKVTVFPMIMDIVCRANNRMLVGLPLCRDPDYVALTKQFTVDIVKAGNLINTFPSFLKPIVVRFTNVASGIERAMRHLEPLIHERLGQEARHGTEDWPDEPNNVISWLFQVSKGPRSSIRTITQRILFINFAAIQNTSMVLTHALFDLATHPEYVEPLRQEVEAVIGKEGWSKDSIAKLSRVDSFIKESMRLAPIGAFAMFRKVVKDFTFSDGTTIPAGNYISVPSQCIHADPDKYSNAETFDGFRFEKMRERDGDNAKHLFVSLDLDYLLFGHGRHVCPGRFLASSELKTTLAHILLNYDVKMANDGGRPGNVWYGRTCVPDPKADVLFRKRP